MQSTQFRHAVVRHVPQCCTLRDHETPYQRGRTYHHPSGTSIDGQRRQPLAHQFTLAALASASQQAPLWPPERQTAAATPARPAAGQDSCCRHRHPASSPGDRLRRAGGTMATLAHWPPAAALRRPSGREEPVAR